MNLGLAVIMLLFGSVAGWIGWRSATKPIYRRSLIEPDPPPGMTRREFERRVRRSRKVKRVFVTVLYAMIGAIGGVLFLMGINRH
jgi:hypothetical protein